MLLPNHSYCIPAYGTFNKLKPEPKQKLVEPGDVVRIKRDPNVSYVVHENNNGWLTVYFNYEGKPVRDYLPTSVVEVIA